MSTLSVPPPTGDPVRLRTAFAHCRQLARTHYENFTVGSWLLPRRLRDEIAAVYAFARGADDIADEGEAGPDRLRRLGLWKERLLACAEDPEAVDDPVFLALGHTIARHALPVGALADLLEAFRRDAAGETRSFATFADVLGYCRYSANPVGRIVLALFGYRDAERQERSDDICTALQLTNFWQDVAQDAGRGRIYVPEEDLARFPGSRAAIVAGRANQAFRELLAFEVERTRALFAAGLPLAGLVEGRLAREVRMFAGGGLALLDRIEAVHHDVLGARPTLGRADLVRIMWRGFLG
ncbi:MAG TPA: squalene synthase HpnC [Candidatus Nitrosopolaris sp.]|nr:squalene synthase HpnC [Candidatus Nitrosopolaris sp.]